MRKRTYKQFILIITLLVTGVILCACNKSKSDKQASPVETEGKGQTDSSNDSEGEGSEADDKDSDNAAIDKGIDEQSNAEGNNGNNEGTDKEGSTDIEDTKKDEWNYAASYGTVEVKEDIIYSEDFEDNSTDFTGRGSAKAVITSDEAAEGSNSLFISERAQLWNGTTVDLSKLLEVNENYIINAKVLYTDGPATSQIDCKVEKNSSEYLSFASTIAKKGEWTEITGSIIIPTGTTTASVYFETAYAGGDMIDFYVDSISIIKVSAIADRGELPALKEAYKNLYSIGVAGTVSEITPKERQELIMGQFNSLTPGNELKADSVLDYAACISDPKYDDNPAISFDRVKPILDFAKEAGIPVRGHTLVWHSQTPRWFFAEGYSNDPNAPLVSKELMLKRMENYIKNVLEYAQTNYPGLIYAWDVVNEAVNVGDGEEGGLRSKDSLWYQVIGPEFIEKAFEYARKYADPQVKLFYNDYNTEEYAKYISIIKLVKGLKEKGLIDGIGLQCHFTIDSPSLIDVDQSIRKFGELGLEIQITELDMGMPDNTEEQYIRQAKRYKRFFTMLKSYKEENVANITNVTFWGLSDDVSWLNKPGQPSYPLLFDKYLLQKPAFWAAMMSPDIPLY